MAKIVAVGKAGPQRKAVKGICFLRWAAAAATQCTRLNAGSDGYTTGFMGWLQGLFFRYGRGAPFAPHACLKITRAGFFNARWV